MWRRKSGSWARQLVKLFVLVAAEELAGAVCSIPRPRRSLPYSYRPCMWEGDLLLGRLGLNPSLSLSIFRSPSLSSLPPPPFHWLSCSLSLSVSVQVMPTPDSEGAVCGVPPPDAPEERTVQAAAAARAAPGWGEAGDAAGATSAGHEQGQGDEEEEYLACARCNSAVAFYRDVLHEVFPARAIHGARERARQSRRRLTRVHVPCCTPQTPGASHAQLPRLHLRARHL